MNPAATLPRRRARVTGRALVLVVVIVGLLVGIAAPVRQYLHERQGLSSLQKTVTNLEQQNAQLTREIARLQDPAYIEYLARRCLGMVKKGEIAFVTVPQGGEPQAPDC